MTSILPHGIRQLADHEAIHSAYAAVRTIIDVTSGLMGAPRFNNGTGETAGDYLDGMLQVFQREASELFDRAMDLEPASAGNRAFKAKIALAYELDFPRADGAQAIRKAAAEIAAALN